MREEVIPIATVNYDVAGSESDYGDQPQPGEYVVTIVKCDLRTEKRDGSPTRDLEVAFDLGDDRYAWVWAYPKLNSGLFAQLLRAVGIEQPKGKFNTDDLIGNPVRIAIVATTFNGGYWPRVKAVLPPERPDDDQPF